MVLFHVSWHGQPPVSLQLPRAVPALPGAASTPGSGFIVSGLEAARAERCCQRRQQQPDGQALLGTDSGEEPGRPLLCPSWSADRCCVRAHGKLGSAPVILC